MRACVGVGVQYCNFATAMCTSRVLTRPSLQFRADCLLMLWGNNRGDSIRVLRLCDFFLRTYANIGPDGTAPVTAVCWLSDEGKNNQARHTVYVTVAVV